MQIKHTLEGGCATVILAGRLDTISAPAFESFLKENGTQIKSLCIDCGELEYVSSAGLRVLLAAQKRFQKGMRLRNVSELVMEVFEMTGFADILVIE